MLSFNPTEAKKADQINSSITDTGKYVGVITRAEKLTSTKGTQGIGISFKSDCGGTADYLDLYTINNAGETLPSMKTVHAILGCCKLRNADEGEIKCEKYNKEDKRREIVSVDGYPDLMGKRIGFLLQKELATNNKTGADVSRMIIAGVFQADTELTISEILDKKTKPEALSKMIAALKPMRDSRNKVAHTTQAQGGDAFADFESDIPF